MKNFKYILVFFLLVSHYVKGEEYKLYRLKKWDEISYGPAKGSLVLYGLNALLLLSYKGFQSSGLNKAESIYKIGMLVSFAYALSFPVHMLFGMLHNIRREHLKWNAYLDKPILIFDQQGFSFERSVGEKNERYEWEDVKKVTWKCGASLKSSFNYGESLYKIDIQFIGGDCLTIELEGMDIEREKKLFEIFKEYLFNAAKEQDGNTLMQKL